MGTMLLGRYSGRLLDGNVQPKEAFNVGVREFFFVVPFYLQSILVHSANCIKEHIQCYVEECSQGLLCN
jgi:hypothetical protein